VAQRKSIRSQRRAQQRASDKLIRQRRKLAELEPGGSAGRPLELASASLVEPRAEAAACLACNGPVQTIEHRAEKLGGRRLRIARVRCRQCGNERVHYFKLSPAEPS
jgi:hypothetical protein